MARGRPRKVDDAQQVPQPQVPQPQVPQFVPPPLTPEQLAARSPFIGTPTAPAPPFVPPAPQAPQYAPQAPVAPQAPPMPPFAPPMPQASPAPPMAPQVPAQPMMMPVTPPAPAPQVLQPQAPPSARVGNSLLHQLDMDGVNEFVPLPENTDIEAEIVKSELTEAQSSGNPMIKLQLRVSFPQQFVGVPLYDNVVLIPSAAWKYKSLCRSCTDEDGNTLLSPDGRFFCGTDEQDFVGNIVRFRIQNGMTNNGNPRNEIKGAYSAGKDTPGLNEE